MCRHIGYLGPVGSPAETVLRAPHSLRHQAYAPTDMRGGGTVNVDGFGLGWYPPSAADPDVYRQPVPIWTDEAIAGIAGHASAVGYVAAVRSGSPGMPVTQAACAPFTDDGWLFSHNGVVQGWPESVAGLAAELDVAELLRLAAPTDSVLLWALLRERLRAGEKPFDAVCGLVVDIERVAPGSRLNLLLTDGEQLVATAWRHSLSVRADARGTLVASEPCDDDAGWRGVPDGCAVSARAGTVELADVSAGR